MQITVYGIFITIIVSVCSGLDFSKQQRLNPNTDFLVHESNANPTPSKKENANPANDRISQNTQTFNNNGFPPLPTLQSSTVRTTKRPDFPPLKFHSVTPQSSFFQYGATSSTQLSGKRDYVAPQLPSVNPNPGKVKDLINFYDGKDKGQNTPQKVPSYSSIVQGSTNNRQVTGTTKTIQPVTQTSPSIHTPKPISFSTIVAGTKPSNIGTTAKMQSSTQRPFTAINGMNKIPSDPPKTPSLPSSILNNNNNNNQGSTGNGPSDSELQTISEELLKKDTNNAAKYITINYQEKTTSQSKEDKAPGPLLTIANDAWNITTIQKFLPLLDNYERDTLVNEYVTPQERNEENTFMDAIMSTSVIRYLMNFLKEKGYVTPDPRQQRDFLKQLWFSLYSRGKGKISSSGFEHVFVSELKNGEVSGLHNWIYFSKEETANRVNYLGYLKYTQLKDKGAVLKLHFNQQGVDKPVDSMFIGTSPELEIALYTLCFITRADNDCKLKLGGKDVDIVTHTFRYRSKNLIGSAYPQI